jgi:Ca2+/H+ antiporter
VLAIFGSAEGGNLFHNPVLVLLGVVLSIYIFLKFCGWAKKFQLSAGLKKWVFILTGVGLIVFNVLYSKGNAAVLAGQDWSMASIALVSSLVWVFIFAFVLMAETKPQ